MTETPSGTDVIPQAEPHADAGVQTEAAPAPLAAVAAVATPESLAPSIEAILFSSDKPVSAARLAEVLGLAPIEEGAPATDPVSAAPPIEGVAPDGVPSDAVASAVPPAEPAVVEPKPKARKKKGAQANKGPSPAGLIRDAVAQLNAVYEQSARSFRIEAVAGGYRVMMMPEHAATIAAFQGARSRTSLSHAALESLAIISYKQPITRARLEAIRGVACGEILRSLTERRLVTIVGRAEEVGRPILYGTTKRFLELFGLASLKDLPAVEELKPKT